MSGLSMFTVKTPAPRAPHSCITDRVVTVEARAVYGSILYYPTNRAGELFARLTGNKTFSAADIAQIRGLGFTVEVCGPAPVSLPPVAA